MNEQTIMQDRLAKEIDALLAPYPDSMSRNDFRIACHIGTRTSLYLLLSGLVPCIHTGKRTRCYKIAKADVAAYPIWTVKCSATILPPTTGESVRYPMSCAEKTDCPPS